MLHKELSWIYIPSDKTLQIKHLLFTCVNMIITNQKEETILFPCIYSLKIDIYMIYIISK